MLIIDFGSQDVRLTATYRDVLENDEWTYKGVDMVNGNNIDIVLTIPYQSKDSVLVVKKTVFRVWPGLKFGLKNRLQYFALTRGLSV